MPSPLSVLAALLFSALVTVHFHSRPAALPSSPAHFHFDARLAAGTLDALAVLGPRPTGSAAEAAAFDLLEARLRALPVHPSLRLEVDTRVACGGLRYAPRPTSPGKPGGYEPPPPPEDKPWADALYRDLRLLTARLVPASFNESEAHASALMLAVHVDSQWTTVGGADNGINLATLMEVARALAQRSDLAPPVIFLLSSAEEDGMLGAQAFVASHPWARHVGGVVNLEAMGSGGRPFLFQTGGDASALVRQLGSAAAAARRAPLATSAAGDIFASGAIGSGTDLRVFRDSGSFAALDFAYVQNGHVYHTTLDDAAGATRDLWAVQGLGETLLAFLASGVPPTHATHAARDAEPAPVFYSLFGRLIVHAPPSAAAAALAVLAFACAAGRRFGAAPLLLATFCTVISWLLAPIAVYAFTDRVLVPLGGPLLLYSMPGLGWRLLAAAPVAGLASLLPAAAASDIVAGVLGARRALASRGRAGNAEAVRAQAAAEAQSLLLCAAALVWGVFFVAAAYFQLGCVYLPLAWFALPALASLLPPMLGPGLPQLPLSQALITPAALLVGVAQPFLAMLGGLGGRIDASLGGVGASSADAAANCVAAVFMSLFCSYLYPLLVRPARLRAAVAVCVLGAVAAVTVHSTSPPGAAFSPAFPRPVMLAHMLHLPSNRSALFLASPAPGDIAPLAAALASAVPGLDVVRCFGAADEPAAQSVFATMLSAQAQAGCELRVGEEAAMAAQAAALAGEAPSLRIARALPGGVVLVDVRPGSAVRWALAVNPSAVRRYALAFADASAASDQPPRCDAAWTREAMEGGCSPLGWAPVPPPHPRQMLPWPVVRGAGGPAAAGRPMTLWLELLGENEGECEDGEPLAKLRADWAAPGTEAWGGAVAALRGAGAAMFGKASLPQATALFAELPCEAEAMDQ